MSKYPMISISVTADFQTCFPDGDYTIGRGADPRGLGESANNLRDGDEKATAKARTKRRPMKRPQAAE
jgi:hypothetical protein